MVTARKRSLVPPEFALIHAFANSLDLRHFVQAGAPHEARDALASVAALEGWMRNHQLLGKGVRLTRSDHETALELRRALRDFLQCMPAERAAGIEAARLNAAAAGFPLAVEVSAALGVRLQPQRHGALNGLATILAEFHHAAETGRLDRLKMCASDECRWVFFDRSKPATRRWCSSSVCGNREKTRAYRTRHRTSA